MDFKARFEGRTTKITKDGDLNGSIAELEGEKSVKVSSNSIVSSISHARKFTPRHGFESISSGEHRGQDAFNL